MDNDHGRLEIRQIATHSLSAPSAGLPHARQFACVQRTFHYPNKAEPSSERSYYVSSLDPADLSPQQFLSKIRNHWSIENKNHYPRDRFFDEDRCMIRNHNAARILPACRQLVLSLKSSMGAESTPALCDDFVFNLHKAINIIT